MSESYHHGNLRNDLINTGMKMLCRDGIASFSVRKLSQELGVSHAAAYRHFEKKEDLLGAIFIESSKMFRTALAKAVPEGISGEEALIQLGIGYVHFFISHPEILTLFTLIPSEQNLLLSIFNDLNKNNDVCREIGVHIDCTDIDKLDENSAFGIFRKIASNSQKKNPYKNLSEHEILLGFWSKVHGMATILVTQKNFIPQENLFATIERVLRTPF